MGREIVKDEVSKIIVETRKVISEFERNLKDKKGELKEIEKVQNELKNIIKDLGYFTKVADNVITLYNQFEKFLEEQLKDLEQKNVILLKDHKDQVVNLINENLPDNMEIREVVKDQEWKIVILSSMEVNSKRQRVIHLYQKNEIVVGEMLLIEDNEELIMKIRIKDELDYKDFKIDNPLKVFLIINHINTRFNYKVE